MSSDHKSHLTSRLTKAGRKELAKKVLANMPETLAALGDEETIRRMTEEATSPLQRLTEDTEDLLHDLGIEIPTNHEACHREVWKRLMPDGFANRGAGVQPEDFMGLMARLPDVMMDPQIAALQAYGALKAAEEGLSEGNAAGAVQSVALGASFIARALTAKHFAEGGSKAAAAKHAGAPASRAMREIRGEWDGLQRPGQAYPGDAAFALAMHAKYAGEIRNEGSIKNAIVRWRKGK